MMRSIASAALVALGTFLISLCIFSPVMRRYQEKEDGVRSIKEQSGGTLRRRKAGQVFSLKNLADKRSAKRNLRTGRMNNTPESQGRDTKTIQMLTAANIDISEKAFGLIRLGCGVPAAAAGGLTGLSLGWDNKYIILTALGMLCLGMLLPARIAGNRAKKRKQDLFRSMPDAMDLLLITCAAGLSLDSAILRISEYDASPCIQELKITVDDISHGVPKKQAFSDLAKRCNLKEMTSFCNSVVQAEELGVSVREVLTQHAASLRETRRFMAEEKANKAPIKITLPLVGCIFPAIFVILLGPAVLSMAEYLL